MTTIGNWLQLFRPDPFCDFTDALGAITDTYSYDAFGIQIASTSASATPTFNRYRYVGEQHDDDLGLIYLRARYMNPASGRFWSMDSYEGGSSDPMSLHKYLYAHADPVMGTDPSGELTLVPSNFIDGRAVEAHVRRIFLGERPSGISNRALTSTVGLSLGLPIYALFSVFPDLVDPIPREVYDVKSIGETPEGVGTVAAYAFLLNYLTRSQSGSKWHAGDTFNVSGNNALLQLGPSKVALIFPTFYGVIPYQIYQYDSEEELSMLRQLANSPALGENERRRLLYQYANGAAISVGAISTAIALKLAIPVAKQMARTAMVANGRALAASIQRDISTAALTRL